MKALPPWRIPEWTVWLGWKEEFIPLTCRDEPLHAMVLVHDGVVGLSIHPRINLKGAAAWIPNQWTVTHLRSGKSILKTPAQPMVAALTAYTLRDLVERAGESWDTDEEDFVDHHFLAGKHVIQTVRWKAGVEAHLDKLQSLLKR